MADFNRALEINPEDVGAYVGRGDAWDGKGEQQKAIDVTYKGKVIKGQRIDLLVWDEVVVDLKSVRDRMSTGKRRSCPTLRAPAFREA